MTAPLALGERVGRAVVWLHLLLWDPVWLLGGLLFLATGERYRRLRSGGRAPMADE